MVEAYAIMGAPCLQSGHFDPAGGGGICGEAKSGGSQDRCYGCYGERGAATGQWGVRGYGHRPHGCRPLRATGPRSGNSPGRPVVNPHRYPQKGMWLLPKDIEPGSVHAWGRSTISIPSHGSRASPGLHQAGGLQQRICRSHGAPTILYFLFFDKCLFFQQHPRLMSKHMHPTWPLSAGKPGTGNWHLTGTIE